MRLYNTFTRRKEELIPGEKLKIYVCGITPYDFCHIGHARAYLVYDFFLRFLELQRIPFFYVQNFTDVDDKIIDRAKKEGVSFQAIAQKFIEAYFQDMEALRIRAAHIYPKVTDHISEIVAFIERLLEQGFAYQVETGVYFDLKKFPDYGKLSGKKIEELKQGARVKGEEDKKDPADFALWKRADLSEPGWSSPFGYGRPGWHIECSVLSTHYLGPSFDIHGGASELAFPHHENEIAQSEAALGVKPCVRLWMHCGLVTVSGQKMSKSLGNVISIREALSRVSVNVLRFALLMPHYRSPLDFSWETLASVQETVKGIEDMWQGRACQVEEKGKDKRAEIQAMEQAFFKYLEDDLNTPQALAVFFDCLKKLRQEPISRETFSLLQEFLKTFAFLFGLDFTFFVSEACEQVVRKIGEKYGIFHKNFETLIEELIFLRAKWRKEKEYARADQLRKELHEVGLELEDTASGTRWVFRN